MKRLSMVALLFPLLLAACQAQSTSTPIAQANTPIVATTQSSGSSKGAGTATAITTPTPTGPPAHSSSSNPKASNLIVVKDQPIINNSLTFDTVISAQASFIVLYYDKPKQGTHELGKLIVFAPVPAGKSNQLSIPLSQNLNPTINIAGLPGNPVDAVLQTDTSKPNSLVKENGQIVMVTFSILSTGAGEPSIFSTATP